MVPLVPGRDLDRQRKCLQALRCLTDEADIYPQIYPQQFCWIRGPLSASNFGNSFGNSPIGGRGHSTNAARSTDRNWA